MSLSLAFEARAVGGGGRDGLGPFVVAGRVGADGSVSMLKQYVTAHAVSYEGTAAGNGIAGMWTLASGLTGPFRIWPLAGEADWVSPPTSAVSTHLELVAGDVSPVEPPIES